MSLEKIAGITIILGVAIYVLAMFVSPRLYQEPNLSKRMSIVDGKRFRWYISQIMFALGIALPALGFLLLTRHHGIQGHWSIYAGASSFTLGALLGVIFVYRQTFDPLQYWKKSQPSWLIVGAVLLILIGLFLCGVAFVNTDYPSWAGYIAIVSAVIMTAVFLLKRSTTSFLVATVSYLITFFMAIVLII